MLASRRKPYGFSRTGRLAPHPNKLDFAVLMSRLLEHLRIVTESVTICLGTHMYLSRSIKRLYYRLTEIAAHRNTLNVCSFYIVATLLFDFDAVFDIGLQTSNACHRRIGP